MLIVSIRVNLRDLGISQKKLEDQASAGAAVRISAQPGGTQDATHRLRIFTIEDKLTSRHFKV